MTDFIRKLKKIYKEKGIYYLFLAGLKKIGLLEAKHLRNDDKLHNFLWFLYSRLSGKPLMHVIGDSHALVFKRKRLFIAHHIGPATAYNLKNEKSTTNSNQKLFALIDKINRKRDMVILTFGEIDCRIHIYNEHRKSNGSSSITSLINGTISNYGDVLERLHLRGVNFLVLSIPPASRREDASGFQFYANPAMRSEISKEFNARLKKFCEGKNYKYIDICSEFSDKDGFIKKEYAADETHISSEVVRFVRDFLRKN